MHAAAVTLMMLSASPQARFEERFGVGGAELSGYRLTQPRYGEARTGDAIMVWVTEPFSRSKTVKLDDPTRAPQDAVTVLKLNFIKHFTTGVYEYSLMTSVFSPIVAPGGPATASAPLKVAFSSQEWCGITFHQLTRAEGGYVSTSHSYFESEGDQQGPLKLSENALLADDLFFRARELVAKLDPGTRPLIPSLEAVRLAHVALEPGTVKIARAPKPERVIVPAGTFATTRFDLELVWGPAGAQQQRRTIWVEQALPHRIIAWESDVASFKGNEPVRERGELTGSLRNEYWKHNQVVDEPLRRKLGLLAK